jgi:ABC-type lipoprotein export system ATPase subunit
MSNSEGSIWRIWDLHVHTPASYQWQGKDMRKMSEPEKNGAIQKVLESMNESKAEAFAIMDYWTFDGYHSIRAYLKANPTFHFKKPIFPGIELRCEAPVDYRLNIHVIMSNTLEKEQLDEFQSKLKLRLVDRPVSWSALESLGRSLTDDKIKILGSTKEKVNQDPYEASLIGAKAAVISRDSLYEAVDHLKGQALIMVPWEPYHGLKELSLQRHPVVVTEIMGKADIWETRKSAYIDLFHGRTTDKNRNYIEYFLQTIGDRPRPTVSGSDAHSLDGYGNFPVSHEGERITWIKADLTFEGLRQTINEPSGRTFIGSLPPQLNYYQKKPTYYIKSIKVWKKDSSDLIEKWFDCEIPINPSLVAIIGNKGSGKSALLDIIALLGNCKTVNHFSFLTEKRFRTTKKNKATHFKANLVWRDGSENEMELSTNPDANALELVKYIPQSYLESVCNEVDLGTRSQFSEELESVIFSHVPTHEKLSHATLRALIEHKRRETDSLLRDLRSEIGAINLNIVEHEIKLASEYRVQLENGLALAKRKLDAHDAMAIPQIDPPKDIQEDEAAKKILGELMVKESELTLNSEAVKKVTDLINEASVKLDKIRVIKDVLATLSHQTNAAKLKIQDETEYLGIILETVLDLKVNTDPIERLRVSLENEKASLNSLLSAENETGLASQAIRIQSEMQALRNLLAGPSKIYQEYLAKKTEWKLKRDFLLGSPTETESYEYYIQALKDLDLVPTRYEILKKDRLKKMEDIFSKISSLVSSYENLYLPVQSFSEQHALIASKFKPEFSVQVLPVNFQERFFASVNRAKAGSYHGSEEGIIEINKLINETNFASFESVSNFVTAVIDRLHQDYRHETKPKKSPSEQLKGGTSLQSVYDFVSGLDYLSLGYSLKLQGKELSELSPGERGSLLLMFYLLVDRSEMPLLIDQPEENLDNQTVFSLIGECIKEAKNRRQIIIVTHNPNLAVACDAEQIICASKNLEDGNAITYQSGSIEDPTINKQLLDILEGTEPAFENRDSKYQRVKAAV